jgi:tryptophan synthase alpha chain
MSRRYAAMFERLAERREGAFGAFVMLGDPTREESARILDALVEGGADMIEVGIPFSDPIADGPTIQAAATRALGAGVRTADCFSLLSEFRARSPRVPVGVLTYANLLLARGRDAFYSSCAQAGVDSVLVADVPAFEAPPFVEAARAHGIEPVLIAAPNTPPATLERIASLGGGYTYCVARAGVTGSEKAMELQHGDLLRNLKRLGAPPAILGFGISTPDHVGQALGAGASGIISGSAIVRLVEGEGEDAPEAIRSFVHEMKQATRRAFPRHRGEKG